MYLRLYYLRDELGLKPAQEVARGMFISGNKKCKMCGFVKIGPIFCSSTNGGTSTLTIPLIVILVGLPILCTITSFRAKFNNHKSSLRKFGNGNRGSCGEQIYAQFLAKVITE